MTRLDRLLRVRRAFQDGCVPQTEELFELCVPDFLPISRHGGPGDCPDGWLLRQEGTDLEQWVSDPLTDLQGAHWLVQMALPMWDIQMAHRIKPSGPYRRFEARIGDTTKIGRNSYFDDVHVDASTLPLAVCFAVVVGLVHQEERRERRAFAEMKPYREGNAEGWE